MAVSKISKFLGIDDLKIFKITKDDETGYTYEAGIDISGVTKLSLEPTFSTKELKGDETVLDSYSKLQAINFSFDNVRVSLDALKVLIGGDVTSTTDSETWALTSDDLPSYFKMEAQVVYGDNGDSHFILYKAKAESVSYTLQGEEYATISVSGKALGTIYDKKVYDVVFNQDRTDIVTTAKSV